MPRIDAHVHVFAKASAEFPRETSDWLPADREEPMEKLLKEMETHRIDQAVLVQIGGTRIEQHAYLLHCLKTHPDRFRGIGLIPNDLPDPADHMDRLCDGTGIIGFRLSALGGPRDPLDRIDARTFSTYPIWKRAAEKDYVLWLYPRAGEAHLAAFILEEFPQVRVVFNHLFMCPGKGKFSIDDKGRPRIETPIPPLTRYATHRLNQYENVCGHLSGQYAFSRDPWPYRDFAGWHAQLIKAFGASRLMWATDFPWIVEDPGYGSLTRVLNELLPDLTEPERADVMGGTAQRFLRFPARR